jgi:hypothetical protein
MLKATPLDPPVFSGVSWVPAVPPFNEFTSAVGAGVGEGLGGEVGVGLGEGLGGEVGEGLGLGDGDGDGDGLVVGDGVGVGLGEDGPGFNQADAPRSR